jgi:hypothetical protein
VDIDDLLAKVPVDQLAGQLGVESPQAEGIARQAITALVGGMGANAEAGGVSSLLAALGQHAGGDFRGGTDLAKVDTADGGDIVANIFGGKEGEVISQLGGLVTGGGGDSLFARALPLLAPLVLRWVGNELLGDKPKYATGADRIPGVIPGNQDDGDDLGGMLGGLLGGSGGGDDVLGGLAGGLGGGGGLGALGGLLGGAGGLGGLLAGEGGGADLGGVLDGLLGDGKKS